MALNSSTNQVTSVGMVNECPQCKFPVPREGSRFCNQCGTDLQAFATNNNKPTSEPNMPPSPPPNASPPKEWEDATALNTMIASQNETNSAEATIHVLSRDGNVFERDLTSPETRIGKGPQNEIVLTDASVSSTHAMISFADGVFTISDLGSRNGTFVNEVRLTEPRRLQHGDLIKMGHCAITFRLKEAETTQSIPRTILLGDNPPPPPVPPPPPKSLPVTEESLATALVSSGLVAQTEIDRLKGTLTQGRRLCRALIEEKLVSEIGLRDLMGRTFNLAPIEMKTMEVDAVTAAKLGLEFLRARSVCPVIGQQPDRLMLAIADPTDKATVDQFERVTGKKASLRLALFSEITKHIENHFMPRLIGVMPTGDKIEALLNQAELEIGKAPHNKLVINDPTVSSTHAIVLVRDGGYTIVDLGSSNGTFINGNRLGSEAHTLQHGDKIQLGNVLLTYRNPAETTENKTARLSLEALEEVRRRASLRSDPAHSFPRTDPGVAAVPPSKITTAAEDESAEKPEKKKKKKKDDRLKAAWVGGISRILAQVLGVILTVGLTLYLLNREPNGSKHIKPEIGGGNSQKADGSTDSGVFVSSNNWQTIDTGFLKGRLESSGIAYVLGSNGALVASDNLGGEVQWMEFDASGKQVGKVKNIPLGVPFADPESITYGNSYYYVISSQSSPSDQAQHALTRFAFDTETKTIHGHAEVIPDLRAFLLQNVSEIAASGAPAGSDGGLNIEGIAWDRNNERLLLGLRSPLLGNQAVLVPLKLRDPRAPFNVDNLKVDTPHAIILSLDGQGIRDITYDTRLNKFLIISGAPENAEKTEFGLWTWSGQADAKPVKVMTLDAQMKPEGITSISGNGQNFVFVVGDVGSYLKLDYSDIK